MTGHLLLLQSSGAEKRIPSRNPECQATKERKFNCLFSYRSSHVLIPEVEYT